MGYDYSVIGVFEEFQLSLELFSKMFPKIFGKANDMIHGQVTGLADFERVKIMNELWNIRWSDTSNHPMSQEFNNQVVELAKNWLSHEIDAYNLIKQQFWEKISEFEVDVYRTRGMDVTGQISFEKL